MDHHRAAVTAARPTARSVLERVGRIAIIAIPVGFLTVFFAWPVIAILARGLAPDGALDLDPLGEVLTDASLRGVFWFTIWQAALSTVLTLVIGIPGAFVLSRYRFHGRAVVRALVTVPFVLPTVVVGTAFRALGISGSLEAILAAHVFFNYAVVVRTVGGLWSHLDPRPEEAAQVLGADRWRTFVGVTLPALRPAIVAAASIVFLFCFTSFGVILVLGGPQYATLETEIYRQTAQLLDLPVAAALAIVQLGAVLAALSVGGWARGRRTEALGLRAASETSTRPRGAGARAFLTANLGLMAVLLGTPIAVLVLRSFGPGLDAYRALAHTSSGFLEPPIRAVWTSLRYATMATALALIVGGAAAFALASAHRGRRRGRWLLDLLIMLPLGVSAVTVGFGFLIALDEPPLDLRTSTAIIPIAHALIAIPFVVRVMLPVLQSIDPRLREVAAVLGAAPRRVWLEVDLRIAARAALVAAGFAFAISLGEFGATLFIVRPETTTLPVAIYRLLGRPGAASYDQAMAASTILMGLTAASVLIIERLRVRDVGEF
jgi:thiamine transport system permease protein